MLISVGSENPVKIMAVERAFRNFSDLGEIQIIGADIKSGVREQPIGKLEMYQGAHNRAKGAFDSISGSRYGIGVEDGLETVKLNAENIYLVRSVCTIYDGRKFVYGEGSSYQVQDKIAKKVLTSGVTIDKALVDLGLTNDERMGHGGGLVSLSTKGKVTRQQIVEEGVRNCLAILINKKNF